jgi:hypothetical protein
MIRPEPSMFKGTRALAVSIAVTLVVLAMASRTLSAQSPTVVMFYGEPLKAPIYLTDADAAAFGNLLSKATVTSQDVANRPYRSVAIFWASRSNPANNGTPVNKLTPEMAWQHGRLYLPAAGRPALLLTTMMTKVAQSVPIPSNDAAFVWGGPVSDAVLAVLKEKGVIPR